MFAHVTSSFLMIDFFFFFKIPHTSPEFPDFFVYKDNTRVVNHGAQTVVCAILFCAILLCGILLCGILLCAILLYAILLYEKKLCFRKHNLSFFLHYSYY